MLWKPTLKTLVVKLAAEPDTVTIPSVAAPSLNVTVPLAPLPPNIAAENVTPLPTLDGFDDEATVTAVTDCTPCAPAEAVHTINASNKRIRVRTKKLSCFGGQAR